MGAIGLALGILTGLGVLAILAGARRTVAPVAPVRRRLFTRERAMLAGMTKQDQLLLAIAVVAGAVLYAATGMFVMVLLVPTLGVVLPRLLSTKATERRIKRMEAVEEWSRSLEGHLRGGRHLNEALVASATTAPLAIRDEVQRLADRLRARIPLDVALYSFADDLAGPETGPGSLCPPAELVAAQLLTAADPRGGSGIGQVLGDISSMVSDEVRGWRRAEIEREDARTASRLLSLGMLVILIGVAVTPYGAIYHTAIGQIGFLLLIVAMVGALYWIKRSTTPPPPPRILLRPAPISEETR